MKGTIIKNTTQYVKIGDLFHTEGGWEKTEHEFYQVVGITSTMVKVAQVSLKEIKNELEGDAGCGMKKQVFELPNEGEMCKCIGKVMMKRLNIKHNEYDNYDVIFFSINKTLMGCCELMNEEHKAHNRTGLTYSIEGNTVKTLSEWMN